VLVEAGAGINGAFLREGLVDRVVLYYAEVELGAAGVPFTRNGPTSFALQQQLTGIETRSVDADVCIAGYLQDPWAKSSF
jgi:riboflavin biosynthesis pyrimidine reductase